MSDFKLTHDFEKDQEFFEEIFSSCMTILKQRDIDISHSNNKQNGKYVHTIGIKFDIDLPFMCEIDSLYHHFRNFQAEKVIFLIPEEAPPYDGYLIRDYMRLLRNNALMDNVKLYAIVFDYILEKNK